MEKNINYTKLIRKIRKFFFKKNPGDTTVLMTKEEAYESTGTEETINGTIISHPTGKGLLVHWQLDFQWTKALLLTEWSIQDYGDLREALEWFFKYDY